ncbi:AraC-like DNA-binding protein [Janthinobacterium sp. CG_23.3]|uniref:AraC family transcriptional regulator n=1 Tax=Janthinobacterium sp. CG_23.3 TaxID=3349634 RepID=UPI0038D4BAED
MKPDLELVCVRRDESFTAWSHGYPYRTVRWHFHPEYEIQLITSTTGKFFVGDYIGDFEPGNLVMSGPNLPHNWVSELPDHRPVQQRCLVLQFSSEFIADAIHAFPELRQVEALLAESRSGLLFTAAAGVAAKPLMLALLEAKGCRRVLLFLSLLDLLLHDAGRRPLASPDYLPDPNSYMSSKINLALAYIGKNLSTELRETDLAELTGQNVSSFSRSFRKHTGISFVHYVNQLRIRISCEMLTNSELSITEICYKVGFNNLSNFNRQFLAQKGIPPSKFRRYDEMKTASAATG